MHELCKEAKILKSAPFRNVFGALILFEVESGEKYIEMDDRAFPVTFGPLTEEQEAAFYTLCSVKKVE